MMDVALECKVAWCEKLLKGEKTVECRQYPLPEDLYDKPILLIGTTGADGVASLGDSTEAGSIVPGSTYSWSDEIDTMHASMMSSKTSMTGAAAIQRTNVPSNTRFVRNAPAGRKMAVRVTAEAPAAKGIETTGPNFTANKDIQAIMDILPHRYPFLLVDRVLEVEHGKYAVGYKCVTVNDNFFPGHFPQRAIMPGVLQVEALAQLGGIAMIDPADAAQQNNFFFGGVDNVRWRKPVVPGDVLMMRVDVTKFNKRFGICKMDAKAYVGEDLVCDGELTLVMGK